MLIVVGLGNPGSRFSGSRHNIGFRTIDQLARINDIRLNDRRAKAIIGRGLIGCYEVVLAKPRTFMNNSGEAIKYLLTRFCCRPSDLLIVYDEMAIPIGRIRLRPDGSHAGHNGIKSIISSVQTEKFPRLRIGVGQPSRGTSSVPHVLGKFSEIEEPVVTQAVNDAIKAIKCMLEENIDIAMNRYNVVGTRPET